MTRGPGRRDRELDEEIEAHLRMAADDRIARGEAPEEAEAAARRELGNVGLVKEVTREQWGRAALGELVRDARFALRALLQNPGFALAAILALALGIGANTAILSVVDAVLLRPLPYADPGRLVVLLHRGRNPVAPANFLDWRRQGRSFAAMGAADYWTPNLTTSDQPEKLWALRMTADVLPMLGVRPLAGRLFTRDEEIGGRDRVAVIGYRLWQRRFAGDPGIVGRAIPLNGLPYTVVGVMPEDFRFAPFWATNAELWAPLDLGPRATSRESQSLRVFARLKPGVSLAAARAEIAAITARLDREFPGTNREVAVVPLQEKVVGEVRPALLVLLGAVGLVLLIACANVAHMLLARAAARQREIAVRAALGASRGRLIRQTLTESLVLSLLGSLAGVALAAYGLRLLIALAPPSIPRLTEVGLDSRVLLATLAVSILTGIGFGLAPALQASAVGVQPALQEGGRAGEGRARSRLRRVFVASEVALALVLLVGAGLMLRTFVALRAIDPGFDRRNVLTMIVSVGGTREEEPSRRAVFYRELLERARAVPGVRAASLINHLPLAGDIWGWPYRVEGRPRPRAGESPTASFRVAFPGYFRTMGIPLLRGRDIAESDVRTGPGVVVVNEFMAKRQWPGEDPIGRRVSLDDDAAGRPVWLTVIGVSRDAVRAEWSAPPEEEVYLPFLQSPLYLDSPGHHVAYMTLVARGEAGRDPAALAHALSAAVWSIDPSLPISEVQTMDRVVADATAGPRFQMLLLAIFASVAVILAAVGIYGVMSYAVSRRYREIGVRMALGASAPDVLRLVVGEGMSVALAGAAAGLAGALLLTRLMRTLLYGVGPTDPPTYAGVAALLLGIAFLASYIPARRAAHIDPIAALRRD